MKEGGQSQAQSVPAPRKDPELSDAFKNWWVDERMSKRKMTHAIETKRAFLQISCLRLDDWGGGGSKNQEMMMSLGSDIFCITLVNKLKSLCFLICCAAGLLWRFDSCKKPIKIWKGSHRHRTGTWDPPPCPVITPLPSCGFCFPLHVLPCLHCLSICLFLPPFLCFCLICSFHQSSTQPL